MSETFFWPETAWDPLALDRETGFDMGPAPPPATAPPMAPDAPEFAPQPSPPAAFAWPGPDGPPPHPPPSAAPGPPLGTMAPSPPDPAAQGPPPAASPLSSAPPYSGADSTAPVAQSGRDSQILSELRYLVDGKNADEMMLVFSAGQSLAWGTTLLENFAPLWPGAVDAERAFMLDFNHPGLSARGWGRTAPDAARFDGIEPMTSQITETPAPALIHELLAGYDAAGRTAPPMLSIGTSATGASLLELMASASDLRPDPATALARTEAGDLVVLPRADGRYDYCLNEGGALVYLNTHRFAPGLWDTMRAQIGFALEGVEAAGLGLHDQVAIALIQGQGDRHLSHPDYDYGWALTRYLDMIEAELAAASGHPNLRLTVALPQVRGDGDGNVPLAQFETVLADPRLTHGGTQWEFQGPYPSAPGQDATHLSPEGYLRLGQTVGAALSDALLYAPEDPIRISAIAPLSATEIEVHFSGLSGQLIADPSIFTAHPGLAAPPAFGFSLQPGAGAPPAEIHSAVISGPASVTLTFGHELDGAYDLRLGLHDQQLSSLYPRDAFESFNGTILRDSEAQNPADLPPDLAADPRAIFEFVPIQSFEFFL